VRHENENTNVALSHFADTELYFCVSQSSDDLLVCLFTKGKKNAKCGNFFPPSETKFVAVYVDSALCMHSRSPAFMLHMCMCVTNVEEGEEEVEYVRME
jgi:hypothetical protein